MDTMLDLIRKRELTSMENARKEIRGCNELSERFGLALSEEDITELVLCRKEALKSTGRVEFGGGILPKLIYAFCDSPYIQDDNYKDTLIQLQEAFYYFKSEAMDYYTDDDLIEFMVSVFHGRAQGSAEYLIQTSLEALCRYARMGFDLHDADQIGDLF